VFTIDISMQPQPTGGSIEDATDDAVIGLDVDPVDEPRADPIVSGLTEDLVLSDSDVKFLSAIGISDPSWCQSTSNSSKD